MNKVVKKEFLSKEKENPSAMAWLEDVSNLKSAPDWVNAMRAVGYESFSATGLPTMKDEDWKYTNLRKLKAEDFSYKGNADDIDKNVFPDKINSNAKRLVVIDGIFNEFLSDDIENVEVSTILNNKDEDIRPYLVTVGDLEKEPFKALNSAYMQDGIVVKIKDNMELGHPIEILYYNSGDDKAIYPRSLYWVGKNSRVTFFEHFAGKGNYLFNYYLSIVQEEGSNLKLYRVQDESKTAYHFSNAVLQAHRDSSIECFNLSEGAEIARMEIRSDLVDSGINNKIGGVYLMRNEQSNDFRILTQHLEPNCKSHQLFRGVADDKANVVFQGKIYVAKDAQKTDADQLNKSILLSDNAKANFKPELEIYADDVRCTHGATTGHIDNESLFYIMSRGVSEKEAKKLLVQAFLNGTLEQISCNAMKDFCERKIEQWLDK